MYSRLDSIFRTQFLGPEPTDTGLHIRHDEERDERKKDPDEDQKDQGDSALWTDSTEVSVSAVTGFLESLLAQAFSEENTDDVPSSSDPDEVLPAPADLPPGAAAGAFRKVRKPLSPQAQAAVSAYQTTAAKTGYNIVPPRSSAATAPGGAMGAAYLSADEVRAVHLLIKALKALTERNITTLTLQPAETFLQSLVEAADRARG